MFGYVSAMMERTAENTCIHTHINMPPEGLMNGRQKRTPGEPGVQAVKELAGRQAHRTGKEAWKRKEAWGGADVEELPAPCRRNGVRVYSKGNEGVFGLR